MHKVLGSSPMLQTNKTKKSKHKNPQNQSNDMTPYFNISSLHCLCVAKQAIAHILISTPVWNCFPRMSHTPWLGVATVRFYRRNRNNMAKNNKNSTGDIFQ
jgi:hypothetical protein